MRQMKTECMMKYTTKDEEYQARINRIHDTDIWIGHYRYAIRVLNMYGQCTVCLDPYGSGDVAESGWDKSDYGYTHGGKNFRIACDVADDFDQYISGNVDWLDNAAEKQTKKYAKKHGI
jgi:hypothetical protein